MSVCRLLLCTGKLLILRPEEILEKIQMQILRLPATQETLWLLMGDGETKKQWERENESLWGLRVYVDIWFVLPEWIS